jgi:hypothetical protein
MTFVCVCFYGNVDTVSSLLCSQINLSSTPNSTMDQSVRFVGEMCA